MYKNIGIDDYIQKYKDGKIEKKHRMTHKKISVKSSTKYKIQNEGFIVLENGFNSLEDFLGIMPESISRYTIKFPFFCTRNI